MDFLQQRASSSTRRLVKLLLLHLFIFILPIAVAIRMIIARRMNITTIIIEAITIERWPHQAGYLSSTAHGSSCLLPHFAYRLLVRNMGVYANLGYRGI